ncbi:MAG TPA: methyltransferase domain-containing protein [Flavitalea sp.]|nr:methyltransferase domain-containing protein [Flavitalea sp.]
MNFAVRSYEPEIIDNPDLPFIEISRNMKELRTINSLLGGHRLNIQALKIILADFSGEKKHPLKICEIGCGGGDNLKVLAKWCKDQNIPAEFTGIDINSNCIRYAREFCHGQTFEFIISDYREVDFSTQPDVIFSSLFCHHFKDEALVEMFHWMYENCCIGYFINDLHRHRLAYYSIRILTQIFSKSRLVKNDGPLSVLRGFIRNEFIQLLKNAGIRNFVLKWTWAFRWQVIVQKKGQYDQKIPG